MHGRIVSIGELEWSIKLSGIHCVEESIHRTGRIDEKGIPSSEPHHTRRHACINTDKKPPNLKDKTSIFVSWLKSLE